MKQQTIFDYIDLEQDTVYLSIKRLKINEAFSFGKIKVSKVEDHYEIESDYCHEFFKDITDCYKRLIEIDNLVFNESLVG